MAKPDWNSKHPALGRYRDLRAAQYTPGISAAQKQNFRDKAAAALREFRSASRAGVVTPKRETVNAAEARRRAGRNTIRGIAALRDQRARRAALRRGGGGAGGASG